MRIFELYQKKIRKWYQNFSFIVFTMSRSNSGFPPKFHLAEITKGEFSPLFGIFQSHNFLRMIRGAILLLLLYIQGWANISTRDSGSILVLASISFSTLYPSWKMTFSGLKKISWQKTILEKNIRICTFLVNLNFHTKNEEFEF